MASTKGSKNKSEVRLWTAEQVEVLQKNWPSLSVAELAARLGKTPEQVRYKLDWLGLRPRSRIKPLRSAKTRPAPSAEAGPEVHPSPELPVPPAMLRLAEFDPVVRRAAEHRRLGRKPAVERGCEYAVLRPRKYG